MASSFRGALSFVLLGVLFTACPPVPELDGGVDAGEEPIDAGVDAGPVDAGLLDAGFDAGVPDAGAVDAGPPDAGLSDGGCVYRLDPYGGTWITSRPLALELADMNGDGLLDFVLATTSALEVRLNDGSGGYVSPSAIAPLIPQTLAVKDVDGDGLLDVVSVDVTGVLTFLKGDGDGGLSLGARLDAGAPFFAPLDTAIADLDGDGHDDFVTVDVGGLVPELRVVRGVLEAGAPRANTGSHRLLLSDVNEDGLVDALLGNAEYGLAIHHGDGDAGFDGGALFLGSTGVNSVALADVTGDGVPDAVCASGYFDGTATTGGGVTVLRGEDAGFAAPAMEPMAREIVWALVLSDLNRDGLLDAVTTRLGFDGGLEVMAGDDGGAFSSLLRVPSRNAWAIAVGDLNEDGWPDVALGSRSGSSGEVHVLYGSCQ